MLGKSAEGFDHPDEPVLDAVRELHTVLDIDEDTALHCARVTRTLRDRGALIGANYLWIAATCLHHAVPLVTANVAAFCRVPGLEVIGYR